MFPNLGYLYEYFFGHPAPGVLYVMQSFGFMMALAFFAAAYVFAKELQRREKLGFIRSVPQKVIIGKPVSFTEYAWNAVIGFFIGFKVIGIILNFSSFQNDPQGYLISWQGSLIGGIAIAFLSLFLKYRDHQKQKREKPEEKIVQVFPHEMIGDITIRAALWGLLGAKLFDDIEHWSDFISDPIGSIFSFSGLAFYGGLIFGAIAVTAFIRKRKIPFWHTADSVAPALILAYGIGRIGCQLSGDGDWGIVNSHSKPSWFIFPDWVWKFNFPHNVISEGIPMNGCTGKYCFQLADAVYPTSFYETIFSLLIFIVLLMLRNKFKTAGMIFCLYIVLAGIERFFIEFIRVNIRYNIFGVELSQAQIISVLLVVAGIAFMFILPRKNFHESGRFTEISRKMPQ